VPSASAHTRSNKETRAPLHPGEGLERVELAAVGEGRVVAVETAAEGGGERGRAAGPEDPRQEQAVRARGLVSIECPDARASRTHKMPWERTETRTPEDECQKRAV
jgi:hypothetical protein